MTAAARDATAVPATVAALAAGAGLLREHDEGEIAALLADAVRRLVGADAALVLARDSEFHRWAVAAQSGEPADDLLVTATAALDAAAGAAFTVIGAPPAGVLVARAPGGEGGELAVAASRAGGAFGAGDGALVAELAAHAGAAVRAARLHADARREGAARRAALAERDHVTAVLQQTLLPPALPRIDGVDLGATYRPMSEGIGGDFYDVFPLRGRDWGISLGDVCGKGPGAAAVAALARHTLHTAAMLRRRPRDAVRMLNEVMLDRPDADETFCTAVLARLQVRERAVRLVVTVAGHPPLIVLRSSGATELVGPTGRLLGLFDAIDATDVVVDLYEGDACVFYTDGATDVRRDAATFGDEGLLEVVAGCRGMPAQAIATSIENAVGDFQRGDVGDDLAVVVVRVPITAGARAG